MFDVWSRMISLWSSFQYMYKKYLRQLFYNCEEKNGCKGEARFLNIIQTGRLW